MEINKNKIKKSRIMSYYIDEDLVDQFDVITNINRVGKSEVVNQLIRDYVIKNKATVNEVMLNYWKNQIDI